MMKEYYIVRCIRKEDNVSCDCESFKNKLKATRYFEFMSGEIGELRLELIKVTEEVVIRKR